MPDDERMKKILEWKDENTLVHEMSKEDLYKHSLEVVKQCREFNEWSGENVIETLQLTTFKQKLTYRQVGFWLSIHQDMCSLGSVFPRKYAKIQYGDEIAGVAGIVAAKYKRGWKHGFLDREASQDIKHGVSLKKVVEGLIESAKRDIDWYLDVGKPEIDKARDKIFAGIGKIKIPRRSSSKRKRK